MILIKINTLSYLTPMISSAIKLATVKIIPTKIRIIEMYADKTAYQSHLQTPHFFTTKPLP